MSVTWNPDDKNANITLSEGNLKATATNTAWKSVRATSDGAKSSGKWYWEVTITNAASAYNIIGVGTSDATLSNYAGYDVNGYGYLGYSGYKFHSASSSAYGDIFTTNDVVGVALDLDNGKIWWSKNGVWQGGGDPAAGTNEAYSGLTGIFYPMGSPYTSANAFIANFGDTILNYDPPNGFYSLGYNGYFSGYVYEVNEDNPVNRIVYLYRRDTGALVNSTTSSGDGYYRVDTTYSGSHFIIALDNESGIQYNLAALDWMIPVTIS